MSEHTKATGVFSQRTFVRETLGSMCVNDKINDG